MITTTYKCDRCGHEQTKDTQMWNVWIGYACLPYSRGYGQNGTAAKEALWCRPCMKKMAVLGAFVGDPIAPIQPPPTLEETIREIIRDEIEAATGARA